MEQRGKLICLLGVNGLGKTTQATMLVERLKAEGGVPAKYVKFARYDLAPSGPLIDAYFRQGNPDNLSAREMQMLQVLNRTQFNFTLGTMLAGGTWIVAEDYTPTGIAWGWAAGVNLEWLINLNSHLLAEDAAILFDGEPFPSSFEPGHTHESNMRLRLNARSAHLGLQKMYGWPVVKANGPIEGVHSCVWNIVSPLLSSAAA